MGTITRNDRAYFHYEELEEYHAGMWRIVRGEQRKMFIVATAELMRNPTKFEAAMRDAVIQWPKSCAAALTNDANNRIAWLGQAGCCIGAGSSEEATRAGWHTLSVEEQGLANRAAANVLEEWDAGRPPVAQSSFAFGDRA